ncbi:MAG: hypothetical protein KF775_14350 [Cyclobacteriaceae bacterium]|nr:hypothetical protein [Cyclobacteriaceae bacterium]
MKIFGIILLALWSSIDPGKIGQINSLKAEAKTAFEKGDYKTAAKKYHVLIDSLGVKEDEVRLNLAHAYFKQNDTTFTQSTYQSLLQSTNTRIKSIASQQLGVLAGQQNKNDQALAYFKQALLANPANEQARYNYELLKKKLAEEKKKEQDQKKKDPNQKDENKEQQDKNKEQNKDQNEKDKKENEQQKQDNKNEDKDKQEQQQKEEQKQNKEQQQKENSQSVKDKLKEMDMSEEKARMILEAMKNQETQYLQQNKRKATQPKDKNKPDW